MTTINKTLLQIAKEKTSSKKTKYAFSKESLELAVATLKGEITVRQAAEVLGMPHPGQITHWIPTMLRAGVTKGLIEIKWLKQHQK